MKYFIFILFFVSITTFSIAQKEIFKIKNTEFSPSFKNKDSYSFSNHETGELSILIGEHKILYAYLLDSAFNKKRELKVKSLKKSFNNFIGYTVKDKNYRLVFTNKSNKKYAIINYDFNTQSSNTFEIDLVLKKEEYVKSLSLNNRFFLLTITKNSSDLIIRELINDTFSKTIIPFENNISLYNLLLQKNDPDDDQKLKSSILQGKLIQLTKIDNKNPNSIETTSELNKLYSDNNSLIFTFDNFNNYTLIFTLDLNSFELSKRKIYKDKDPKHLFKKSNSYIFNNLFFQIQSSNDKMVFSVRNFETGGLIKKHAINIGAPITIKNTPIIQEKTASPLGGKREMEVTAKYLRKITAGNLGISAYKIGANYQITLGGTKEISSGGGGGVMMTGGGAMTMTSSGTVSISPPNMTYVSYGNYSSTKSTYIKSLFNEQFEHQKGAIKENVFDKIEEFEDHLKHEDAINIFLHNNTLYFGYFDLENQVYKIFNFTDN
ncbi:MAG: hypothetical protein QM499_02485 [Flavobacteriaceae bacterium]